MLSVWLLAVCGLPILGAGNAWADEETPPAAFPKAPQRPLTLVLATSDLRAGEMGTIAVQVSKNSMCVLRFGGARTLTSEKLRYRIRARNFGTWSWRVPARGSRGSWSVNVKCKQGSRSRTVRTRFQVAGGEDRRSLVQKGTMRFSTSKNAPPPNVINEIAGGGKGGGGYPDDGALCIYSGVGTGACSGYNWGYRRSNGTWYTTSARGFDFRNCTDFAAWATGLTWSRFRFDDGEGDAADWRTYAGNAGLREANQPSVGDIAWWGSSVAGGYGHVAIVTAVNSDGSVSTADYNGDGRGNYTIRGSVRAHAYLHRPGGGGKPSAGGYQVAFQANTGAMISFGDGGGWNTGQGMKAGTSPSYTRLNDGRMLMAFQANTGNLIVVGPDGGVNTQQGMMAGTSPSIAASPSGGYRVAFQANNGSLYVYDSQHGASNQGQGMKAGTSPAIAALSSGGYEMAFQANTGNLFLFGDGPQVNTQQGMMAGTSPDIASNGPAFRVAFQANNGNLYTFDSRTGATSQGQGMKVGTSPAIAPYGGGFEMAFQANNGNLHLYGDGPKVNTGQGMLAGTSPDIASNGSNYRVAFQANNGNLYVHDSQFGTSNQGQGMMPGTSPSIAAR